MVTTATRTPPLAAPDAELFAAARLRAARLQPYLATAIFSLVPIATPGYATFGVDRWWRVYVDMDVAREWGVEATAAVLVHEAHHLVRDHHRRWARLRLGAVHHHHWNMAGDLAINDDLRTDELPLPDPLLPEQLGFTDGLIEEVYFHLLAAHAEEPTHSCGSGAGGAPLSVEIGDEPAESGSDGLDVVDQDAIRRAVAHDVQRAVAGQQRVAPGLARWAKDLLCPQVPWRSLLRSTLGPAVRAVSSRTRADWSRPDRRAESRPDFLHPGERHHRPEVAVVIDTSASMSPSLLDAAVTEINSLLHRAGVRELTVVTCDATAALPQRVRRLGDLTLRGGGGTDLRIGVEAAAASRPAPSVIVVLTDGFTPWPLRAPGRSSLVAVVIDAEAPLPTGPGMQSMRIDAP